MAHLKKLSVFESAATRGLYADQLTGSTIGTSTHGTKQALRLDKLQHLLDVGCFELHKVQFPCTPFTQQVQSAPLGVNPGRNRKVYASHTTCRLLNSLWLFHCL